MNIAFDEYIGIFLSLMPTLNAACLFYETETPAPPDGMIGTIGSSEAQTLVLWLCNRNLRNGFQDYGR